MGLSGITAALVSPTGSLTLVARYDTLRRYDFNRIRIFCNAAESGIVPEVNPDCAISPPVIDPSGEFVEYQLNHYRDTLTIHVTQSDSALKPFQLYGISLENDDPGVIYNAIGVNGAKLESYLRCERFVPQLRALEPDWVIVSIGTNEGNTRHFDPGAYRSDYIRLIDSIRFAAPHAAILLTVPNDSYLFKRYVNPNTARIREIIFELAQTCHCGVWDFYTVMGGLNSAMAWYNQGLMNKDRIHFNRPGYLLKGDLFFSAFMKSWDDHLLQVAAEVAKPPIAKLQTQNPDTPILLIQHPASGIQYPASMP
jgi:lysophospholipase L1-like esterase